VVSPAYVAVIITLLGEVVDAMYVTLQVPDDKVQEVGLKFPPTFPSPQVIVPVGAF